MRLASSGRLFLSVSVCVCVGVTRVLTAPSEVTKFWLHFALTGPGSEPPPTPRHRKSLKHRSEVKKRGRPSKWPPECLPSKFADFECAFSYNSLEKNVTPKDLFWRGLSGTNSGGRFAPGRFCLLPNREKIQSPSLASPPRSKELQKIHTKRYFRCNFCESSVIFPYFQGWGSGEEYFLFSLLFGLFHVGGFPGPAKEKWRSNPGLKESAETCWREAFGPAISCKVSEKDLAGLRDHMKVWPMLRLPVP